MMKSGATFSRDRVFRYRLWRRWGDGEQMTFIGLNPSTADERSDDQTIRKCVGFAKRHGCEGMLMLNLFAFRARHPQVMKAAVDPVGPRNDRTLLRHVATSEWVVACWGNHGQHQHRDRDVIKLLAKTGIDLLSFGITQQGLPRHPMMLSYSTELTKFRPTWPGELSD